MVLWLFVLAPQLYRTWRRQSTEGLSVLWATANCTASICSAFFVFQSDLPLFAKITAIYMPTLELLMLALFFHFCTDAHHKRHRVKFTAATILIWTAIVCVGVFGGSDAIKGLQWAAVALWSVESIPQLFLNVEKRAVHGQAPASVFITVVGKTTDSMSAFLLAMPLQVRCLAYFSSTFGWINALQVVAFGKESARSPVGAIASKCLLLLECVGLVALAVWRLGLWALAMPTAVITIVGGHFMYRRGQAHPTGYDAVN